MNSWLSRFSSEPQQEQETVPQESGAMLPEQMVMFAIGIECSYPVILNGTHHSEFFGVV